MKKVKAMQGQNIYDITLRAYGSLDGLGLVLQDNRHIDLTTKLATNTLLYVRDVPVDAVRARVMAARGIVPATSDNYKVEEWTTVAAIGVTGIDITSMQLDPWEAVDYAVNVLLFSTPLTVGIYLSQSGVTGYYATVNWDDSNVAHLFVSLTVQAIVVATDNGVYVEYMGVAPDDHYLLAEGLASNTCRWICEFDGKTVIGTDNGISACPDITAPVFTNYLAGVDIRSGHVGADGLLYLATDAGMTTWDGTTFVTLDMTDGLPSNDIRFVMVDSRGVVWLSTEADGLVRIINGNIIITDSTGAFAPTDKPRLMVEDRLGRVFVAFEDDGTRSLLAIIDTVNGWTVLDSADGILPEGTITAMTVDVLDNIYIGTTAALHYWNRHPLINI